MTASAAQPLRIGLVGAGWVTQHHLVAWRRESARARVVAIADPSVEQARARAAAFDIASVYPDARTMFEHETLDAVDIAAPREAHVELVRLAAERRIPTLCQKPLAPTYDAAASLVADMARLDGMRLMVHENWRFRAYYRQAAQWLRAGRIGRVLQAQMSLFSSGLLSNSSGNLPALVRQPFIATLDRALVSEILIHHIDTLRFLLGEMTLAQARLGRTTNALRGEDRATLMFDADGGATALLVANLATHGMPPAPHDGLTIIGERGTIRLEEDTLCCHGLEAACVTYDLPACYVDSYAAVIAHFLAALNAGTPFETSPEDNLRTLRLVEDAYAGGIDGGIDGGTA